MCSLAAPLLACLRRRAVYLGWQASSIVGLQGVSGWDNTLQANLKSCAGCVELPVCVSSGPFHRYC